MGLQNIKPLNEDHMILSIGPHHPSTHGVLRVVLELDGETIVRSWPEHGFLHTGIEKHAEHLTWQQAMTVLERMDYLSPISNNLGYCLAVERLLGIEAPPRAQVARVILAELQRIASHLVWLGTGGLDLGAMSIFFYCFNCREWILDIMEETTGARMNMTAFRAGGLQQDLPENFVAMVRKFLKDFPPHVKDLHSLLDANPIFKDRLIGTSKISAEKALSLGLTGPNLRGSGVPYDIRKAFPYSGYEQFNFSIPVTTTGDNYGRYLVRMAELDESLRIIEQALNKLPGGEFRVNNPKIALPPKSEVKANMEALIHQFKLVSTGFEVPKGEIYQAVESPRGEIGFYVISDGGTRPARVRVRPPSFYSVHALPSFMDGELIADMVAVIASADPVFGEVDR